MKTKTAIFAVVLSFALSAHADTDLSHVVWSGLKHAGRASKTAVVKAKNFMRPKTVKRAGDGSPIPTCIPGHPCDDDDQIVAGKNSLELKNGGIIDVVIPEIESQW